MKIPSLQKMVDGLEAEHSILQIHVDMNNQTISKFKDLEAMGFGLHELSFLSNTVNEIAFANDIDIPTKKAVRKFLIDVEEQYDKSYDLIEAQFRSMVKKPPEPPDPPSMRALLDGNGNTSNNSNNDSNTSEYFKLRDQVYVSSAGVIKQIGSQQIEQEGEEQQRSLQQKIKDIDDRSHYYVP